MSSTLVRTGLALLAVLTLITSTNAADEFLFKDGDRVLFLGDSITEQYHYSSDIETYLTTRFPKWRLQFLNAGISGDTATGGISRFKAHILDEKPTVLTINFGMNDGGYGEFDKNRCDQFIKNTEKMLEAAAQAEIYEAVQPVKRQFVIRAVK